MLKTNRLFLRTLCYALSASVAYGGALHAAATDIGNEPLAQPASNTKPNVMMILDDSGSMRQQYTPDYLGRLFGSAEELCFDSLNSGGSISSTLEDCEAGDPPIMSPDVNTQYYNPEIRYFPAVNFDGTSMPSMTAANTANWTAVPTDGVSPAGVNTFRVNLLNMNGGGGSSETTSDLMTQFPDRAWCNATGTAPTDTTNCRVNSGYTYPNQVHGYGKDGSGNIKFRFGVPYYYRLLPTEFCSDVELKNCVDATAPTGLYTIPAPVRFCDSTALTNCQGKLQGSFVRPKYTGEVTGAPALATSATATITVKNPQSDSFSGTITAINVFDGTSPTNNIAPATVSASGPISPSVAAMSIRDAINAATATNGGYTATVSSNVVTIVAPATGAQFNGNTVSVVSPSTPSTQATVTFDVTGTGTNDRTNSIIVSGIALIPSTITCTSGAGCTGSGSARNDWMGNAIASAINGGTATHGFSASTTSSGSRVTITAPSSTGGEMNGTAISINETGLTMNFVGASTFQGGSSSGDIETTATNFSGGQDANPGRISVGNFVRVNLVPFTGSNTAESYEQPFTSLNDMAYEVKSGQSWGQTFRHDSASATYSINQIGLVLYRAFDAAAGQTLTVSLRSSWNGAAIASGTVSSNSLGTVEAWVSVNLASSATLNDNQTYIIRVDGNGSGKVYVGVHDSGAYAGGDFLDSSGVAQGGKDMVFRASAGIPSTFTRYPNRTDCSGTDCIYDEEMTNFANWYAYYRSRMQMAKTALGRSFLSIDDSFRVGFITINPGSPVSSNRFLAADDFTDGAGNQKDLWYQKLYGSTDNGSTPLREALSRVGRYFAGVTSGINNGMGASPIQLACQANYAILSTDGYWNGNAGQTLTGGSIGNQDNSDSGWSTRAIGAYDGGLAGSSNTLADVAIYYYKTDLRTDLADNVPTTSTDTAAHQHMTTYTVGLGLAGLLNYDKNYETQTSGDFFNIKTNQGTFPNWPVPVPGSETALDDLWHAAVNGRGKFFSAQDPVQLADGISETLSAVQSRVGAGAAAATSNLQPVAGDNFAFTAQYQTVEWTGDLKARTIDLSSGAVATRELWSAQILLDQRNHTDRRIYTYDASDTTAPGTGNGNRLKALCWPGAAGTGLYAGCNGEAELSAAELDLFNPLTLSQATPWPTDGSGRDVSATKQNLVDYLRGDAGNELSGGSTTTDLYRNRNHLLGDIVNAQPAYVKSAPFSYNTGSSLGIDPYYQEFKQSTDGTTATRKGTVYAAANDGMLHAFETDPDNIPYYQTAGISTTITSDDTFTGTLNTNPASGEGAERWAYVPSMVLANLKQLAESPYTHRYYVDGSPAVGDVCFGHTAGSPCASQANWRTILVAGLNAGGRGYYALDISDPDNPKALWEFKGGGGTACLTPAQANSGTFFEDCNLGLSYSTPIIVKRKSDGKWVVLVSSGYNNVTPGDGQGHLYILDAQSGAILNRIDTGVGCDGVSTTAPCVAGTVDPSGLGKVNAWVENSAFDNTTVRAYAGDLQGNVWRFQLDPAEVGYLSAYKLVTVSDPSGVAQPITVKPELGEVQGFAVAFLATGRYLGPSDPPTTQVQSIYAIRDDLTANPMTLRGAGSEFVQQTLTPLGSSERTSTSNVVDFNVKKGWYIDLPDPGERVNVDPVLQLGTLVVASNVPSNDACVAGGFGWVNFLDFRTGGFVPGASANMASTKIGASLVVGINVIKLPGGTIKAIVTTADNQQLTKDAPVATPAVTGRRVSWRELIQ